MPRNKYPYAVKNGFPSYGFVGGTPCPPMATANSVAANRLSVPGTPPIGDLGGNWYGPPIENSVTKMINDFFIIVII